VRWVKQSEGWEIPDERTYFGISPSPGSVPIDRARTPSSTPVSDHGELLGRGTSTPGYVHREEGLAGAERPRGRCSFRSIAAFKRGTRADSDPVARELLIDSSSLEDGTSLATV
jgi:hypothetical protein